MPYLILARPYHEEIDKTQELVGKIVDLIKREQIRMNLIEEDQTEILNESSVRKEIENMNEENRMDMRYAKFLKTSVEDVKEAVDLVDEALNHEPIFDHSNLSKHELSDVNLLRQDLQDLESDDEEDETTLEDIAIGVYQALPEEVQGTIRETYLWGEE